MLLQSSKQTIVISFIFTTLSIIAEKLAFLLKLTCSTRLCSC